MSNSALFTLPKHCRSCHTELFDGDWLIAVSCDVYEWDGNRRMAVWRCIECAAEINRALLPPRPQFAWLTPIQRRHTEGKGK